MGLFRTPLRDIPVLAELAVDVASGGGDGEGGGSGEVVEERLLLNGINVGGADAGVDKRIEGAGAIFAHAAMAALSIVDDACARTELAPDFEVGEFLVEPGLNGRVVLNGIGRIGAEALCRVFSSRVSVFEAFHVVAFAILGHKIAGLVD